jgi:D-amino-acid dehydrogenase
MPDSLPVIGASVKQKNVYYGFGHGHLGLCGGAPTGHLVADLIGGRRTAIDLTPFRIDRF